MGLDNGFILKNDKLDISIELAYFRKYFELDDYVRCHATRKPEEEEIYLIDLDFLTSLQNQITPIYEQLVKIPTPLIAKYDDSGYPEKYDKYFYGNDFNPRDSGSAFAGAKLMRLYRRVDTMIELFENRLPSEDWYIEFYSSY